MSSAEACTTPAIYYSHTVQKFYSFQSVILALNCPYQRELIVCLDTIHQEKQIWKTYLTPKAWDQVTPKLLMTAGAICWRKCSVKSKHSFNDSYICYIFLHMNMVCVHVYSQTTDNRVQHSGFQGQCYMQVALYQQFLSLLLSVIEYDSGFGIDKSDYQKIIVS